MSYRRVYQAFRNDASQDEEKRRATDHGHSNQDARDCELLVKSSYATRIISSMHLYLFGGLLE